ncbi:MAG: Gfo/Idh/MocA family protein [Opitutales bacterium]
MTQTSASPNSTQRIVHNVAILGYGKMGRTRANAIAQSERGHLVRVFDVTEPAETAPADFTFDEHAILNDPSIDAVFICTPNHRNQPLTIAALEAGKHVFCEKPPAFNAAGVEAIRAAEAAAGTRLMYGFNHRHHESIKKAKAVVDAGEFGRVLWMRGRYGKSVTPDFLRSWRAQRGEVGGGILLDQGIHMLDLFLLFAEDFDEVQAMVSNVYWDIDGLEDNVFANFRNRASGVVASLHSTMTQWRHLFSLEIFLERGHIVLNGLKTSSNSYGDEVLTMERNQASSPAVEWGPMQSFTYPVDTSWLSEVNAFFDAIESSHPVQAGNSADALKLMRLVDRIYAQR